MKNLLTLLLIAACSTSVLAQEGARIGVKAGYNSTWLFNKNVSDKNASMDYASSFGTSFGVLYMAMLSDNYGITAEVLVSSHNQKYDGGDSTVSYTLEENLSYIDIPILFRSASEKGPYFEIGPMFSFLTGAKESYGASPSIPGFGYDDKEFKDDFNSFGLSMILGFGVDIKLTESWRLTPGLRFGYTLTDGTTEYSESELEQRSTDEVSSAISGAIHNVGSELYGPNSTFGYEKSHRAFGGLHLALSYTFN